VSPEKLPLLAGQTSIWVAEQFGPLGRPYNARWSISYERAAATDTQLVDAVTALAAMHPCMRLRVGSDKGIPYQIADRPPSIQIVKCDQTDPAGTTTLRRLAKDLAHKKQRLEEDSLTEIYVVSARQQVHVLALQHHLALDAIARAILSSDLDQLVRGFAPPSPPGFAESVVASRDLEATAISRVDDALEKLGPVDAITLPEHPRAHGYGAASEVLSPLASSAATAFAVLAAATGLTAYLPEERCLIAVTVSTRPHEDTRIAGCFVNTVAVPVSVGLSADPSGAAIAQRAIHEASSMRHLPSRQLTAAARQAGVALAEPERVIVTAINMVKTPGFAAYPFNGALSGLVFRGWDMNDATTISLEYPRSLLSDQEASVVFGRYRAALRVLSGS